MSEVLVTGGFGFLGSHLVDSIAGDGQHVHVVDDLSSNAVNPAHFSEGRPITSSETTVKRYLADSFMLPDFDGIYHLASIVGPAGVLPHEGKIAKSIINDTAAVARVALEQEAKLVFVSTSEVYGGGQDGLCSEEMPPIINPEPSARLEYAIGKLASEIMLQNQVRALGLDAVIIRPFNIAGARQSGAGGFVLPRFVDAAVAGEPLTVFGSGQQIRAFTDVRDVSAGIKLAMKFGQAGEVYNIGNPKNKTTIIDLARRVVAMANTVSGIELVNPRDLFGKLYAEANDKFPDSSKAERYLGWEPRYDIDDIIKSVLRGSND